MRKALLFLSGFFWIASPFEAIGTRPMSAVLALFGDTMRKVRLEQLTSGMRLAQDVVNFSGQVLLYKGNPLQPKDIKNFKAWGIIEIAVESSSLNASNSMNNNRIDTNLLVEAQKEISNLFKHSNLSHPVMAELMRLSTLNKLKQKPGMENVNVY